MCSQNPKSSEKNSSVASEGVPMALSLFSKVEGAVLSTMLICFFKLVPLVTLTAFRNEVLVFKFEEESNQAAAIDTSHHLTDAHVVMGFSFEWV